MTLFRWLLWGIYRKELGGPVLADSTHLGRGTPDRPESTPSHLMIFPIGAAETAKSGPSHGRIA